MRILAAETREQIDEVRRLFEQYWNAFGFTPCFQNFAEEVAHLPGAYASPGGRLGLALIEGAVAGCIALRPLDARRAEMKRLYVRPEFRGHRLGHALVEWIIDEARTAGYREIVCDTLPVMGAALAMYEQRGFERIEAYAGPPSPGTIYLRLALSEGM